MLDAPTPLSIVLIEDDLDACENLRDILEFDQHRVSAFQSARAALASPELCLADVILLDWKLPDASALELLPLIGRENPNGDVIIITGFGDFERAVTALREGAADYLLKPINAESLRASVGRLSHRRWLARAKARSDEMFRHVVEAAPSVILIIRPNLDCYYFSPHAEKVTGYSAAEMVGQSVRPLLGESDPATIDRVIEGLLSKGELWGQEVEIVCRDGTRRWLMWNGRVIDDVRGEPGLLIIGQDITQQKQAVEKLVQSERLAAIGEAMTGLAHESRNALQRSQAYLEVLASELEGQPEPLALVARLQKAQNHLHQLYEEVRQYAAPLRPHRMPCSLRKLVEETWSNLEHEWRGRDVRLVFADGGEDLQSSIDRTMLEQVFRNILENSLAACTDPTEITVQLERVSDSIWTRIRLTFRDDGPGLTSEQARRIFDPFFTTKTRGTGLGMTLSRRIVEAHGGTITVGDGPGAAIIIELPEEEDRTT